MRGTLDESARAQFEAHLSICEGCRFEIELQRRIDADLIEGNLAVELAPTLIDAIERGLCRKSRRRHLAMAGIAAALLVASAALIGLRLWWPDESLSGGNKTAHITGGEKGELVTEQLDRGMTAAQRQVSVTFPTEDVIAARFETDDPTVTIVMLYLAYKPESTDN